MSLPPDPPLPDPPLDRRGREVARAERAGGRRGGRRPPRRPRRRRLALLLLVLTLAVLAVGGVGGYLLVKDYFATGPEGALVNVVIGEGSSLRDISVALAKAGVVPHARAFQYRAERDGLAAKLKPGTYRLHVNEPYGSLVAALVKGPAVATVKITIPEGYTARQTASLLADKLAGFSAQRYVDLTLEHPLPFQLAGFRSGGPLEGMLFPATYQVRPDISERDFIGLQLQAFKDNLAQIDLREASRHNLTAYDVVILGSMIEREIAVADERPLAAAVMWRRLHLGMPLQIDATIEYVLPEQKAQLTYQDLKIQSPYNTYLHTGLPPTPIANPGAAALRAAAHPANVDYLYYVARGDGSGRHYFSSSYAQFLKDKARAQGQ